MTETEKNPRKLRPWLEKMIERYLLLLSSLLMKFRKWSKFNLLDIQFKCNEPNLPVTREGIDPAWTREINYQSMFKCHVIMYLC